MNIIGMAFVGPDLPPDLRIQFLEPGSCRLLGAADHLPRNSRVSLSWTDNEHQSVNVKAISEPGDDRTLLPTTTECTNAIPSA
jgi:hypothetical protein